MVNTGEKTRQVICGADNVAAGQKVPVARVGATLPPPKEGDKFFIIKKAKIRAEEYYGLIFAEDELGLGGDHSGIMVLDKHLSAVTPLTDEMALNKDSILMI